MRFAVACTTHAIDYIGLDNTSLDFVQAESPKDAVKESIIGSLIEIDEDRRADAEDSGDDMTDKWVGLTAEVLKLPKQIFASVRWEYWRKHMKLRKGHDGWDFYLDLQDYTGCVYGFRVLQVK